MDWQRLIDLGVMTPQGLEQARGNALAQGLMEAGAAFQAAGAPSRTPGGRPLNLAPVFTNYQNALANSMKQGLMMKQLERQEEEHKRKEAQRKADMAGRQMMLDRFSTGSVDPMATGDFERQPSRELAAIPARYQSLIETYAQTKPPVKDFISTIGNVLKSDRLGRNQLPMSVKEWEYYQGLPDEDKPRFMKLRRAPTTRDVGDRLIVFPHGEPGYQIKKGVPPQDVPHLQGEQEASKTVGRAKGSVEATKSPGTPEFIKEQKRISSIRARGVTQEASTDRRIGFINDAIKILKDTPSAAGMFGKAIKGIPSPVPGTQNPAFTLSELLKSIKANIGFDELQKLREMSPTGGALGQVAVQELEYLQALLGSLEQGLDDKTLIKNLSTMRDRLLELQKFRAKEITSLKVGSPLNTEVPKHLFKKVINYDSKGNRID